MDPHTQRLEGGPLRQVEADRAVVDQSVLDQDDQAAMWRGALPPVDLAVETVSGEPLDREGVLGLQVGFLQERDVDAPVRERLLQAQAPTPPTIKVELEDAEAAVGGLSTRLSRGADCRSRTADGAIRPRIFLDVSRQD